MSSNKILLVSSQDSQKASDRLMTLRPSGNKHAEIISAYASMITNQDKVNDKFYGDLDSIISSTVLFFFGDFNARVGTDHQVWEGLIGSGIG